MASLITVRYLHDDVLRWRVHTEHQETLFLNFLLPSIAQQLQKSDADLSFLEESFGTWAEDELLVLGYVSCYHLWERQSHSLISSQVKNLGLSLPPRAKESFTTYVRNVLAKWLNAELPDTSLWQSLERARRIVNAYKHGPGHSFEAAKKQHPEFFCAGSVPGDPALIRVTRAQFEELLATLKAFWDSLPYSVKYV